MFLNKIHKTEKPEALTYIGLAAMDVDGLVDRWTGGKLNGGEEWWIKRITVSTIHERLLTMRIYENMNIQEKKLVEQTIGTAVTHC